MKAVFSGAGPTTGQTFYPADTGNQWQVKQWHLYVNGTFGASGQLQVQYSPDGSNVADASKRWFAPTLLTLTAGGDTWFQARFRALRFVFNNGDGTTSVTAEIV